MITTPRTDAEIARYHVKTPDDLPSPKIYVSADFARLLETELAAANERIVNLTHLLETNDALVSHQYTKSKTQINEILKLMEERDVLARWKHDMLLVESWWAKIDAFVREQPGVPIGRSVSDIALEWLKERPELLKDKARLDRLEATMKRELGGGTPERHVSCDVHTGSTIRDAIDKNLPANRG